MKIAVLGTGTVGRTLSGRLAELGHDVRIGTRDVAETLARTGPDGFAGWQAAHPAVQLDTMASAAAFGYLVINGTSGDGSIAALTAAGADNLAGKVLIDVANPLDFSAGFPPTLFVKDTDSLAEQIQRAFPAARVVKTLNTVNADVMVNPTGLAGGDHSVFLSGDDAQAKDTTAGLLRELGWSDIIDLGDLSTARGPELMIGVWLRLYQALGTASFNVKVVR